MRQIKFRLWDKVNKQMVTGKNIGVLLKNINNNDNHIYQQWTGLLDKKGVEIYEGDVVQWRSRHNPKGDLHTDTVEFTNGYWNLTPWIHELSETVDTQVIGNIYENPEILEDK